MGRGLAALAAFLCEVIQRNGPTDRFADSGCPRDFRPGRGRPGEAARRAGAARQPEPVCAHIRLARRPGRPGRRSGDLRRQGDRHGETLGLKPRLLYRLTRLFRRLRPDVVHAHDHRALFYGGPAAWAARVPLLINTRHGRNSHFTPRQVAVGRQLARLADWYVCVSDDVKAQCVAEGIAHSRLLTIKNGINVEQFAYSGPCPGGPVVAVARLSPEKDIANLIRAAAQAAERARDLRVEIAGGGPCLEELEQLAASLGVADRIRFLGEVHDVPAVLARADVRPAFPVRGDPADGARGDGVRIAGCGHAASAVCPRWSTTE